MNDSKKLNAKLIISADIRLNPTIKNNIEKEYGKKLTDFEAAEYFLYAYLNPKIFALNESEIDGVWDGVGEFNNNIMNIELETF